MTKLSRLWLSSITVSTTLLLTAPTFAQQPTREDDSVVQKIDNSKFRATGTVLANNVYVRSGPSDNDYPVMKLDKGAAVTVVGRKFEWLKIVPPEGSFCYVAKAYVDRHGDGTRGKVTSTLNVRVGSTLNPLKTKLATKLEPGSDVVILGDQEEYYKIKPPEDVYLYVNLQFVEATKVAPQIGGDAITDNRNPSPERQTGTAEQPKEQPTNPPVIAQKNPETPDSGGGGRFDAPESTNQPTNPTDTQIAQVPTTNPSTQPSQPTMAAVDAETEFDNCEKAFSEMLKKPLDQQEVAPLQVRYEKLATGNTSLPETLRRVAESKSTQLKAREKDRAEFVAVKRRQEEMASRQQSLRAEREEIETRLHQTEVRYFAAVGVLRPSSLQQGQQMMYRLTDPANGRTVVYLRTNDNKIGTMLGQFIGVKGDVQNDQQLSLRVISPSEFEVVDPSKLYTNVASQIVPPSLMPGGGTTATAGE